MHVAEVVPAACARIASQAPARMRSQLVWGVQEGVQEERGALLSRAETAATLCSGASRPLVVVEAHAHQIMPMVAAVVAAEPTTPPLVEAPQ